MRALQVAKYFINLSNSDEKENITNLKLQKLLYYAQGFYLALENEPLFSDEIQAWAHGPVVPDVYSEFKRYGYKEIKEKYQLEGNISISEKNIIEKTWAIFKSYDGKQLEELTHLEDPWINARKGLPEMTSSTNPIEEADIKVYFENEYIVKK